MKLAASRLATLNESQRWSLPKIQLWVSLLEQEQISAALLLSQGVWEPKKLGEMIDGIDRRLMTFSGEDAGRASAEEWEPPSLARVLKHMPPAQRAHVEKSFAV